MMETDRLSVVRVPVYGYGQTFAYTGTAGNSTAFDFTDLTGIWVTCTTDAYVSFGVDVTATAADFPVAAGQTVWLPLPEPTAQVRVSAIQLSSGGSCRFIPGR